MERKLSAVWIVYVDGIHNGLLMTCIKIETVNSYIWGVRTWDMERVYFFSSELSYGGLSCTAYSILIPTNT